MLLLPPQTNARFALVLLLMLLALSLTGCACNSPPSAPVTVEAPKLPARPPMTEPQPSQPYSESVRALLKTWRERLTATPATP